MDDSYVSSVSGAHKDFLIKGLVGLVVRCKGVRVLGVDLVIKDEVDSSVSGGLINEEGPASGKGQIYFTYLGTYSRLF